MCSVLFKVLHQILNLVIVNCSFLLVPPPPR